MDCFPEDFMKELNKEDENNNCFFNMYTKSYVVPYSKERRAL